MMVGATYHQIGKPTNTTSYSAMLSRWDAMAGRDAGSFISTVLVHPVQIGGLVGDRGLDLEYIGAHRLGKRLREVRGSAGGGEVGNKFFHGYTS